METTENVFEGKLYIGIDIHKRSWKIKTATDLFDGKSFTCKPNALALKQWVDKNFADHQVFTAYEAGCCGYTAHRFFKSFGWHSLVVNPADISKTGKSQYQKTDKIDATLICRELKDARLTSIVIPEPEREALRCLFRRRIELVADFRRIKSTLKMQLLYLGIEIPERLDKSSWSHDFRNWIRELKTGFSSSEYAILNRLGQFEFLDLQIREVSNELRAYCRKHYKKEYKLLRSVPGIGGIVACGILSELGDLRRFKSMKHLAGYVGLCPSIKQSGDHYQTAGMTPRANRIMRSYFVEASWQALRFDPVMQAYYRKHQGKDVKRIIVKVARKLLCRTRAVIVTGIPYQEGVLA